MLDPLIRFWRKLRGGGEDEFALPADDPEWHDLAVRYSLRVIAVFLLLFGSVWVTFRWSGAAVRFGAQRAAGQISATWRVKGVVRDSRTREPVPWALVEDDPAGSPPLFSVQADHAGGYELVTLAEPHRIRISAPNYMTAFAQVGRAWFLWLPRGEQRRDLQLDPVAISTPK